MKTKIVRTAVMVALAIGLASTLVSCETMDYNPTPGHDHAREMKGH